MNGNAVASGIRACPCRRTGFYTCANREMTDIRVAAPARLGSFEVRKITLRAEQNNRRTRNRSAPDGLRPESTRDVAAAKACPGEVESGSPLRTCGNRGNLRQRLSAALA